MLVVIRSRVHLDFEVDPVTSLALELESDVLVSRTAVKDAGVSPISVNLLVQCANLSDAEGLRDVESLSYCDDLQPRGLLDDILLVKESIVGHSRADDHMVGCVHSVLANVSARWNERRRNCTCHHQGEDDQVLLRTHFCRLKCQRGKVQ